MGPRQTAAANHEALPVGPAEIGEFAEMERAVVGCARDADYPWLLKNHEIYRYRNAGRTVGFGCVSETGQGPIVVLEPETQPAILLHFETLAQSRGTESISFQVPSASVAAMHHLLEREYKNDTPANLLMSNRDFGRFDCFVAFAPAIVL